MPAVKQSGSTQATSAAQGRFTVALPNDVGKQIDALAAKMAADYMEQRGLYIELSRPQVVTSLVISALRTFEEQDAEQGTEEASA